MKFILTEAIVALGMSAIVVAKVNQVDPEAQLTPELEAYIKTSEELAFGYDREAIRANQVIKGYRDKMQTIGKSVKKNPPTAEALIKNIQRRGSLHRVNSLVDLYNAEALHSFLAIGAHDFDKVTDFVEFTRATEPTKFTPIGGDEKVAEIGDIVYRDAKGIMAYLDARDSEFYKITPDTKTLLLIMQGNSNTNVPDRVASMERICNNIAKLAPGATYEIQVILPGENEFFN